MSRYNDLMMHFQVLIYTVKLSNKKTPQTPPWLEAFL